MSATKVANGQPTDASQFNGLVDDIDDIDIGHAHSGIAGGGRKVTHSDLLDGAIPDSGTELTHAQINDHIGSTPGAGPLGVHGLDALAYVMGLLNNQYTFEVGSGSVAQISGSHCWGTTTTGLTTVVGAIAVPSTDPRAYHSSYEGFGWCVTAISGNHFDVHFAGSSWNATAVGGLTWFYLAWGTK